MTVFAIICHNIPQNLRSYQKNNYTERRAVFKRFFKSFLNYRRSDEENVLRCNFFVEISKNNRKNDERKWVISKKEAEIGRNDRTWAAFRVKRI